MSGIRKTGPSSLTNTLKNYNRLVTLNKNANAAAYRQFIESHTPLEIRQANLARRHLTRLGVKTRDLKDDRQVTGSRSAYIYFFLSRSKSGDFRGMTRPVAASLIGREWKALTDEQKKVRRLEIPAGSVADVL